LVRLDEKFAVPEMFEYLEAERVDDVVAMARNKVLSRLAGPLMEQTRCLSTQSDEIEDVYGNTIMRRTVGIVGAGSPSKPR